MPTKAVAAETMEAGKRGGGKHWTDAEIAARLKAAGRLKRKEKVVINAPDWLSSGALFIWNRVVNDASKLELLDNLDTDVLAVYCDAVDRYQTLSEMLSRTGKPKKSTVSNGESKDDEDDGPIFDDIVKQMQAWARIMSNYADKLGFTPQARARLAKKRAEPSVPDAFGQKFD